MADRLREYLVSLGFSVQEPSWRHFKDTLNQSEKIALRIGGAAMGVALAVEAMVSRVAAQQEHLFFVSQRTGASVAALQAYEFASTQIGISAEAARSSVEGFGMALRSNPGLGALARSLGVTNLRDAHAAQMQLVGRLRQMPDFVALQFAGMFGMDAQTYINMKNNYETEARYEKLYLERQREAGVGTPQASRQFRLFSTTLRTLEGDFSILEQRIGLDWVTPATHLLKWVDKLVVAFNNMDGTTRKVATAVFTLGGAFKGLGMVAGVARKFGLIGGSAATVTAGAAAAKSTVGSLAGRWGMRFLGGPLGALLGMTEDVGDSTLKASTNRAQWVRRAGPHWGHRRAAAAALGLPVPIKPNAGIASPQAQQVLDLLAGMGGIERVTALNDSYHQRIGHGAHTQGNAIDLTLKDPARSAEAAVAIQARLRAAGINVKVLDEYKSPSANATAGHLHIGLVRVGDAGSPRSGVVQHNSTEINVHGATDANSTARAVADRQVDVHQQMTRAASGVVQ